MPEARGYMSKQIKEKHLGNGCYAPRKIKPKKQYICSECGLEKHRSSFPSGDDKSVCKNCVKDHT